MASPNHRHNRLRGVVSLLLTPFDADRSIDWRAYDSYVDWQLAQQPHGLFAVCGSSEMKWLTRQERIELAQRAVNRAGSVPVVATANLDPDRSKHRDEVRSMIDTGVAGVVLVPPPGLAADVHRFEAYIQELTDASTVPVYLYEWPQVHPYLLPAKSFARMVATCGVAGIKDTTCTIEGITAKISAAPGAVVFQANTPLAVDAIDKGAQGLMAITSTCCPDLVLKFWHAVQAEQPNAKAAEFHRELIFLDAVLSRAHPAAAKYLVRRRGLAFETHTRWPVTLQAEHVKALDAWYETMARSKLAPR